jgi:hypothetical protein
VLAEIPSEAASVFIVDTGNTATDVSPSTTFDYSSLEANLAKKLQEAAIDIQEGLKQEQFASAKVGERLLQVRDDLKHGLFEKWIVAEFGMSPRTARNRMSVARALRGLPPGKSAMFSVLPDGVLKRLGSPSTPPQVRDQLIKRLEAGERLLVGDLAKTIRQANESSRSSTAAASLGAERAGESAMPGEPIENCDEQAPQESGDGNKATNIRCDSSLDELFSELSGLVRMTADQKIKHEWATVHFDAVEAALRGVASSSGTFELIALLADLMSSKERILAFQLALINFRRRWRVDRPVSQPLNERALAA